jgi:hypothetical protein
VAVETWARIPAATHFFFFFQLVLLLFFPLMWAYFR